MPKTDLVNKATSGDISSLVDSEQSLTRECENCHQPLVGPYCGQCGQAAESSLKYFWLVILHLLDDIFSFDSRASRTLWPLLMRPAFLTREYFAGKRVHYVPPLRLYLFISIVFFLTLKFFADSDNNKIINVNDNKSLITQVEKHIKVLEDEELLLIKDTPTEAIPASDELSILKSDINRFNNYLVDLKGDINQGSNKKVMKITRELIALELEKSADEESLSIEEQEKIDQLLNKLAQVKSGKEVDNDNSDNNIDIDDKKSSISLGFLSDEDNKKFRTFTEQLVKKAEKAFDSDTGPLVQQVISKLPQLMFILLPLFAVLLKLMFIFSKRLYMEHLTVALHSHSFIFLNVLLIEVLDLLVSYAEKPFPMLAGIIKFFMVALIIWLPIYLFLMQKRVYNQGYFFTLVKFSVIGIIYFFMMLATGLIAFVWGLTAI